MPGRSRRSSATGTPTRPRCWPACAQLAEVTAAARSLPPDAWALRGIHPVRGEMTVEEIVERFIAAHLEEHADQLDGLDARRRIASS